MTSRLGERFPEKSRKKFCQDRLRPVAILRINMSERDFLEAKKLVASAKSIPSNLKKKYGFLINH